MAAAPDLGSGASRRGGSSPFIRTFTNPLFSGFFYALEKGREVYAELVEASPFIRNLQTRFLAGFLCTIEGTRSLC